MIQSLVQGMKQAFSSSRNLPKSSRQLPIVLSGGTALPEGFRERFEKMLARSRIPSRATEIRMAVRPACTRRRKVRLIAALADADLPAEVVLL